MPVTVRHRVNFYDTDAMAVVHHANYIRWFEIGRVEYLRSIGITLDMLMEDGYVFPITEVRANCSSRRRRRRSRRRRWRSTTASSTRRRGLSS